VHLFVDILIMNKVIWEQSVLQLLTYHYHWTVVGNVTATVTR